MVAVGCAYFGFHAIRKELPPGILRTAFPSLLTPLGMFGVIELLPGIRFQSWRIKWPVLGVTTLVAAIWLEAIVPMWTKLATGDWQDALAMGAGFLLFCAFDWMWGDVATQ